MKDSYHPLSWALNVVALALAAAALAFPVAGVRAVCAVVPWVVLGIMFATGGRLVISANRRSDQPNVIIAVVVPLIVLGVQSINDYRLVDWPIATALGAGIAVLLVLAFAVAQGKGRQSDFVLAAVVLAVLGIFYGYAVIGMADMAGDAQVVQTYRPLVLGKHVQASRSRQTYRRLTLAAWGPVPKGRTAVDAATFQAAEIGQPVCVALYAGRLGLRWYTVATCPDLAASGN